LNYQEGEEVTYMRIEDKPLEDKPMIEDKPLEEKP